MLTSLFYRIVKMKNNCLNIFLLFAIISFSSCDKGNDFSYTKSKIWAHRVNTPEEANRKIPLFDGIEVDLVYDTITGNLYVSHDIGDNSLTFNDYLAQLNNTQTHYWLDVKNLYDNADVICDVINSLANRYNFKNNFFVESWSTSAIKKAKKKGLVTSLWVDNIAIDNEPDTAAWHAKVLRQIETAQPDAISADYRMWKIIKQYFPDKNIHLWHTPADYNEGNAQLTKEMCQDEQVKVVLVDYDEPILY